MDITGEDMNKKNIPTLALNTRPRGRGAAAHQARLEGEHATTKDARERGDIVHHDGSVVGHVSRDVAIRSHAEQNGERQAD